MKVLIVVDMLKDFIEPDGALAIGPTGRDIIVPIREKIAETKAQGGKVVFLADNHAPDDLEFEKFPPHCIAGTDGAEIISELAPENGDMVIPKTRYSGFFNTYLEEALEGLGADEVEVVGCCTSICVAGTVQDLANRDYKVTVDEEAVADFDPEAHGFFLKIMKNIYGAEVLNAG